MLVKGLSDINNYFKLILLSTVWFIFSTETGYAQLRIGGTFGLSKTNLRFDLPDSSFKPDSKKGYTFGALIQYPLTSSVNMRSGIYLTQKGFEDSEDFFQGNKEIRVNLFYLSTALLAQYKFNPTISSAYAVGGMEIGILMSAESVEIISGLPVEGFITNRTTTMNIKDSLSAVDITWNIGGGYEMGIGSRKIFAELQYTFGLNDIDYVDEKAIVKSRGIIIGLGYLY